MQLERNVRLLERVACALHVVQQGREVERLGVPPEVGEDVGSDNGSKVVRAEAMREDGRGELNLGELRCRFCQWGGW